MSNIWVTSDWHLGHDREFIWKARGFNSIEEMNNTIISKHNSLVRPDDDVYVLGDLTLGPATNIDLIRQMNGRLHIVRGNHDTDNRWNIYSKFPNVVELSNAIYLKYQKYHFYLSHYPSMTGNLEKESLKQMTLNLYGHTHQQTNFYMDMPYMYHVGVDSHNCVPILLDTIIEQMYEKVKECKEFLDISQEKSQVTQDDINGEMYLFKRKYCDKCFYSYGYGCPGPIFTIPVKCPDGIKYKRDPPDGGFYG